MTLDAPSLASLPLWQVTAAFVAAAGVVWLAGTRLARSAEAIAQRYGLTRAFVGMALLGLTTSLPEVATVATAGVQGHPRLAVTNLMGGVALQVAVLALADAFSRRALTSSTPDARVLLQGVVSVLALAVAILAFAVGDPFAIGWVGAWPLLLGVGYVVASWVMQAADVPWRPERESAVEEQGQRAARRGEEARPTWRLAAAFAGAALATVAAGVVVTLAAETIGTRTGLGESFAGSVLVAASTSLPEVSTAVAAVRMGAPTLAISNVFGTNVADVALLLVADAFWTGGLIVDAAGAFSIGLAGLGALLTCIYLVGLLERRDRRVGRLGVDSWLVLAAYVAGYALLFQIR